MSTKITPINRFFGLLKSEKKSVRNIYIYAIFNGLVSLSLPLGIQAIITFIQTGEITASWFVLVFIVIGGIFLAGYFQIQQLKTSEDIQQSIYAKSALELAYRIPKISAEKMYKYYPPELANRFFDTLSIQKGLSKVLIDFTSAVLQIFFGLILLSLYHAFFILLALFVCIILGLIVYSTFYKGLYTSISESEEKYKTAHWLEEIARSFSTFKLIGGTNYHINKTDLITADYLIKRKKHFLVLLRQYWSMIFFKAILALILLLVGGFLVINQSMNIGQFVAAEIVILLILGSAEKLILSAETIYDVLTAFDKLGKITDLETENTTVGEKIISKNDEGINIELNNVSLIYPDTDKPVINSISFFINKNEKIGIVGENASGKTSLLNLISTFYKPNSGKILYNGFHTEDICKDNLRENISTLLREDCLFEGTLWENITLNRKDISLDKFMEVISICKLSDFVTKNSNGINTQLKPSGENISQSLVQKILVARSIINKPKLLILGKSVSNISSNEKLEIANYIFNIKKCTVIVASNDENILKQCSKVLLLEKGVLIDKGSFKEISERNDLTKITYA